MKLRDNKANVKIAEQLNLPFTGATKREKGGKGSFSRMTDEHQRKISTQATVDDDELMEDFNQTLTNQLLKTASKSKKGKND